MRVGANRLTRREVLTAVGCSTLALGIGARDGYAASVVSGTVFHDRSGSGRRRWGDPGIPGVMVSNGRDVVLTDGDGRWRLNVTEADSIFVIKPPHWTTPLAGSSPRFSYRTMSGAAGGELDFGSNGSGGASVDFPLTPSPEAAQFEALLLADTQPANSIELAYLRDDILAAAGDMRAAFGINHGDVVFDAHALYPEYLRLLGASGIAWHHCPGNHDIDYDAANDHASRDTWKHTFGPRHYAFQYAGATFIVLDNVYYLGCNGAAGSYCGRVGAEQIAFVRNVLTHVPRDTLVVLSMHIPLVTYQDATSAADNTADRHALLEVLSSHPHCVSFSGHMHSTEHHYLGADEGFVGPKPHHHHVLTAASGGWWGGPKDDRGVPSAESPDGNPNGFHVLSIDSCHYTTRFVPAPAKSASQMRVLLEGSCARQMDGSLSTSNAGNCVLVANVFDGGPLTRVSYEIAGAFFAAQPMLQIAVTDPFVARKPWARPVPSSHVWQASLPPGLTRGMHHIIVTATDEYGRGHRESLSLEVTDDRSRI